ncbi:MAG TPA: efflux RND transporter periplasmic adaptor subunit [Planctomycetaceae bacterium]|nr:efflux RND transporter periplasmic adaptor subunit [Planctomycetaceae bacterium]
MNSRNRLLGSLVVIIVICAGLWIWHVESQRHPPEKATAQSRQTRAIPVKTVYPTAGGVKQYENRPGSIHSFQGAKLYSKVSGYLDTQKVDIGDEVKKGEVLATIYAPELVKAVSQAQADLKQAQSNVDLQEAKVTSAEADADAAQADVGSYESKLKESQADVAYREKQYNRIAELAKQNAIKEELVDEEFQRRAAARATEESSREDVTTAKAKAKAARAEVQAAKAQVEDAQAKVAVAQAALEKAQVYVEYTNITSPYTGVVTRRYFHPGDFIRDASGSDNTNPVLSVVRTDLMRVVVQASDRSAPYIKVGAPATVRVGALGGREFTGKVARIAKAENYETRTMRTEIDLPNPDGALQDGMYGSVSIELANTTSAVALPSACLTSTKDGRESVYVVRDGKAQRVMVLVGADDGRTAEIVKGLTTKDEVVFEHPANMTAGSAVQVVAKVDWKQQHAEETADRDGQRQTAGQHDHEGGTKR